MFYTKWNRGPKPVQNQQPFLLVQMSFTKIYYKVEKFKQLIIFLLKILIINVNFNKNLLIEQITIYLKYFWL